MQGSLLTVTRLIHLGPMFKQYLDCLNFTLTRSGMKSQFRNGLVCMTILTFRFLVIKQGHLIQTIGVLFRCTTVRETNNTSYKNIFYDH